MKGLRKIAKTKFGALIVLLIAIPFAFMGMGNVFNGGNTNNLAKINDTIISTQDFIEYVEDLNIPAQTIRNNLKNNIVEELLSNLISTTILDLEIKDLGIQFSEKSLLAKIKKNENFLDENGNFQRLKYEKFLLENNISAPIFEQRLKLRELQKKLFEYISAGSISPEFLIIKNFEEENMKLQIEYLNLFSFYKKKEALSDKDLEFFISENKENLKIEYLDFKYAVLNPQSLFGIDEFNQAFFDKIDEIDMEISRDKNYDLIISNLNIEPKKINNFRYSQNKNEIEKKIFESKERSIDIIENNNDYIFYKIENITEKIPDLNDSETKKEITELVYKRNKFDFNKNLLEKINNNKFDESDFMNMGKEKIETTILNSIKDNKKFDINSVEMMYSLPTNTFTLISDENENIYLTKVKKFILEKKINLIDINQKFINNQNSNNKNSILETYDLFLNNKYKVDLNQNTIDRVKTYFQ